MKNRIQKLILIGVLSLSFFTHGSISFAGTDGDTVTTVVTESNTQQHSATASSESSTSKTEGSETQPPETQPVETQPQETQPQVTQPQETQPQETQPQETQPQETQPQETQPQETQPQETQPQETQPQETQPQETQPQETQPQETQPQETQPSEMQMSETPETDTSRTETKDTSQQEDSGKKNDKNQIEKEKQKKHNNKTSKEKQKDKKNATKEQYSSQNKKKDEVWQIQKSDEVKLSISGFSVNPSNYPEANISDNTIQIYRYLVDDLGLNHAGACGVLANIQLESNFNPLALGDGGTSYGICQWHNGRFSNLVSYCNGIGADYNTVHGQLQYLKHELETAYPSVLSYLQNVPDTAQGAYDAAHYWCVHFEIPDHTYERATQRGNLAQNEYFSRTFKVDKDQTAAEIVASVRMKMKK